MNIQSSQNVIVTDDKVFIDNIELPPVPSNKTNYNSTIINGKVYINGYEWKNEKWKRTLKALFHLVF